MDLTWMIWWELQCLVLLTYMTGIVAGLEVRTPDTLVVNLGETAKLPCEYSWGEPSAFWLKWYYKNNTLIYGYKDGIVDQATGTDQDILTRYSRDNMSLVITNFKPYDAGVRCCEIQTAKPVLSTQSCINVQWTDFDEEDFSCVDSSGTALSNDSSMEPADKRLEVDCSYTAIYPAADLVLLEAGSGEALQTVDKSEADKTNDRFSLAINVNRTVVKSTTFIVRLKADYLRRDFYIPVQYASSISGGPQERRAMLGATVGIVVLVIVVIVGAVLFGYLKARKEKQSDEFIDDKQKVPHQELVEKPRHTNKGGLLEDKNEEATFDVHA